ncbi:MAG: hypothetical protein AAF330_00660 [Pseudomonadota bacterium]
MDLFTTAAGLWTAVLVSGLYHGLSPGMGWPLAVSAALFEQKSGALWRAVGLLGLGHLIAMVGILLPFAVMFVLVDFQREIQISSGLILVGMGAYLLITRRHPRFLARVKPSRLVLWSFLVAMAHGAGLMLVPIYLGLCDLSELDLGHRAAAALMGTNALVALGVAALHTVAMVVAGGALAWGTYKVLGLRAVRATWLNLEVIWACSLIFVGGLGLWIALTLS